MASGRAKTGGIRLTKKGLDLRPKSSDPEASPPAEYHAADDDVRRVPLLWQVVAASPPHYRASDPTAPDQNVRDYLPLPAQYVRGADVFMVEVKGDSMSGDGVLDGDYVVVASDPTPRNGEMVVALIEDEATVKRLWRDGPVIRLEPSNPDFDPIIAEEGDELAVRGRVIGVLRWHIQHGRRNDRRHAR